METILPRLHTYSSQLELLDFVGHREHIGHQFISKEKSEKLENELVNSILSSDPEFPEHEWNAWRVYHRVKEVTNQNLIDEQTNPILVYMLFKSTLTYFKSQAPDEVVQVEPRLHWDGLLEMFDSEATLRKVVDKLRVDYKDDEIIYLADKYLSGWTPRCLL